MATDYRKLDHHGHDYRKLDHHGHDYRDASMTNIEILKKKKFEASNLNFGAASTHDALLFRGLYNTEP